MRKALIAASPSRPRSRSPSPRRRPAPRTAGGRAIPGCAKARSTCSRTGTLTVGADNPAFPPWFGGAEKTKPWKVSNPYSGKGYESAVAYAVAKQLGFTKAQVKWTVVPFNNSFRPGKKPFDFYVDAGLVLARAGEGGRLLDAATTSSTRRSSARKGTPIAKAKSIAGAQAVQARRPGRHDELHVHHDVHQAVLEARSSTTRTTPPSRRSRTARSTGSSSTCRPRSTSRPCRSTTA